MYRIGSKQLSAHAKLGGKQLHTAAKLGGKALDVASLAAMASGNPGVIGGVAVARKVASTIERLSK